MKVQNETAKNAANTGDLNQRRTNQETKKRGTKNVKREEKLQIWLTEDGMALTSFTGLEGEGNEGQKKLEGKVRGLERRKTQQKGRDYRIPVMKQGKASENKEGAFLKHKGKGANDGKEKPLTAKAKGNRFNTSRKALPQGGDKKKFGDWKDKRGRT